MGSMTQLGVPIGMIFSTIVVSLCMSLTGDSFEAWGWRIPFLLSFALVFIGLYIRLGIEESPEFVKLKEEKATAKQPVLETIKGYPKEILLAAFTRLADNVPFYICTTFTVYYATTHLHMDKQLITNAVLLVAITFLFIVPYAAHLSDKFGRKKIMFSGMIMTLLGALPYFYLINTKYPIEQSDLINITHLPRRTIQSAIEDLRDQGFIIERNSLDDTRRKVYFPVQSEWL